MIGARIKWLSITASRRRPTMLECSAVVEPLVETGAAMPPKVSLETPNGTARLGPGRQGHGGPPPRGPDVRARRLQPGRRRPWFATPFGRDELIISMLGIADYPEFAAGALRQLAPAPGHERRPSAGLGIDRPIVPTRGVPAAFAMPVHGG
jgi:hypothetical protein